jgi:AraC-like DNA-binding protein
VAGPGPGRGDGGLCHPGRVNPDDLAALRRARDLMDREYAQPLNVPALAVAALMSVSHFSRQFHAAYGETPYSYLMTRRIERAKTLPLALAHPASAAGGGDRPPDP